MRLRALVFGDNPEDDSPVSGGGPVSGAGEQSPEREGGDVPEKDFRGCSHVEGAEYITLMQ